MVTSVHTNLIHLCWTSPLPFRLFVKVLLNHTATVPMIGSPTTCFSSPSSAALRRAVRAVVSALLCGTLLVACGPSTDVLKLPGASEDLPPVSPSQVDVYRSLSAVKCEYLRVALVEAQESESVDLSGGVSQVELIRAAREEAGRLGANAVVIDTVESRTFTQTEVEADSSKYERTESRESLGRGMFLAVRENRPCKPTEGRER